MNDQTTTADPNIAKYEAMLTKLTARADKGDRDKFLKTYHEIRRYADEDDFKSMYENMAALSESNDGDAVFKAAVNRAAEYRDVFGSFLYPQNPVTTVVPNAPVDTWALRRFNLEAQVLDYTMRQNNDEQHLRKSLAEALLSGRGMVWYGYNARKNVPSISFDTVDNFAVDPDARSPEEVNWIRRDRRKTRFQFDAMFTDESGQSTALIDTATLKGEQDEELIKFQVFYFRVGMHNFCRGMKSTETDEEGNPVYDDSPKKVTFAEGKIVAIEDWELPMDMLGKWPCELLDFIPQGEKSYPQAPIKPGLTHLKAMNWLYTFYMNRVKTQSANIYARVRHKGAQVGQPVVDLVAKGAFAEGGIVDVEITGSMDPDIQKLFQRLPLDPGMSEFPNAWELVNRGFEDATGLTDLVRSGQDTRQIRTAADVNFKETRSMGRVDDMRKQFQNFLSAVTAGRSFINRFLITQEDVAKWFGEAAGKLWGRLGSKEEAMQEQMQRQKQIQMMMQKAMAQYQEMLAMTPPPVPGMPPVPPPPAPNVEQFIDQIGPPQVIVLDDWINEARREIETSSMRVVDHSAMVDNMNLFFQVFAPLNQSTPAGMKFNASMITEWLRLNRYSAEAQKASETYYQEISMMAPPGIPPSAPVPPEEPPQGRAQAAKGSAQDGR